MPAWTFASIVAIFTFIFTFMAVCTALPISELRATRPPGLVAVLLAAAGPAVVEVLDAVVGVTGVDVDMYWI